MNVSQIKSLPRRRVVIALTFPFWALVNLLLVLCAAVRALLSIVWVAGYQLWRNERDLYLSAARFWSGQ